MPRTSDITQSKVAISCSRKLRSKRKQEIAADAPASLNREASMHAPTLVSQTCLDVSEVVLRTFLRTMHNIFFRTNKTENDDS